MHLEEVLSGFRFNKITFSNFGRLAKMNLNKSRMEILHESERHLMKQFKRTRINYLQVLFMLINILKNNLNNLWKKRSFAIPLN